MSLIAEKDTYMEEVNKLQINNKEIIEKLEKVYDHLQQYIELENAGQIIEDILKELFSNQFTNEVLIPLSFHGSLIGKVIFTVMYGKTKDIEYSTKDIIELAKQMQNEKSINVNKTYISQDIRVGHLNGVKKNGKWVFTKQEVNKYLELIKQRKYTKA